MTDICVVLTIMPPVVYFSHGHWPARMRWWDYFARYWRTLSGTCNDHCNTMFEEPFYDHNSKMQIKHISQRSKVAIGLRLFALFQYCANRGFAEKLILTCTMYILTHTEVLSSPLYVLLSFDKTLGCLLSSILKYIWIENNFRISKSGLSNYNISLRHVFMLEV